jgi:hypothetical protein
MAMKKLTITVTEEVYKGLHEKIGRRNISRFLNDLAKPYLRDEEAMHAEYREMAADELREAEALEWVNGTAGSALDD